MTMLKKILVAVSVGLVVSVGLSPAKLPTGRLRR